MDKNSNQNKGNIPSKPNALKKVAAKAKFLFQKIDTTKISCMKVKFLEWFKPFSARLAKGIVIGLVIGIIFNVIDHSFWPDLSERMPVLFEFFNGFITFIEFIYKVTFSYLPSLFNGNFFEVAQSVNEEFFEMLKGFWSWMSSITF